MPAGRQGPSRQAKSSRQHAPHAAAAAAAARLRRSALGLPVACHPRCAPRRSSRHPAPGTCAPRLGGRSHAMDARARSESCRVAGGGGWWRLPRAGIAWPHTRVAGIPQPQLHYPVSGVADEVLINPGAECVPAAQAWWTGRARPRSLGQHACRRRRRRADTLGAAAGRAAAPSMPASDLAGWRCTRTTHVLKPMGGVVACPSRSAATAGQRHAAASSRRHPRKPGAMVYSVMQ